jgi:hypothetical protein
MSGTDFQSYSLPSWTPGYGATYKPTIGGVDLNSAQKAKAAAAEAAATSASKSTQGYTSGDYMGKGIIPSNKKAGGGTSSGGDSRMSIDELLAILGLGGGGGGGGSYYDPRPAIREQYQSQRDMAARRKGETGAELEKIYSNLASAYKPVAASTAQRYTDASNAAQAGSQGLINATQQRINEEAAKRAAAYAELGIQGPSAQAGESTGQAAEAQYGMGNLGNTAANWGGLLGAQSAAEQGRNNLDYTGAVDSGTLAQAELNRNYNSYLDRLGSEEAAALAGAQPSYSGGGGGGGGSSLPSAVQNILWGNILGQMGFDTGGLLGDSNSSQNTSLTPKYDAAVSQFGGPAVAAYYNALNTGNTASWLNSKYYDPRMQALLGTTGLG